MAVYIIQGKLGTGKTKFCVWMAQQALRDGLRVASNVDLVLEKLTPEKPRRYIRIPDKPDAVALDSMGHGNPESYDEEKNGVLILDELGTWLNARSFQDKSRAGVIDWLIHARKLGWSVYLIVQDAGMVDKQVRESLVEYEVRIVRMDKVRWPFIGKFVGAFGDMLGFRRWGYLPRFHVATARVGYGTNMIVAEKWMYRGDELHAAYDTRQKFTNDYPHGTHCVLPPWEYVVPPSLTQRTKARLVELKGRVFVPSLVGRPVLRPKLPIVASVMRMSPDERIRHIRRIEARGLLSRGVYRRV
jgi:hypothetical protein